MALCVNDKILETGTSNILFVSKNKIFSPVNKFYRGTNLRFYEKKLKINKKNILLKNLDNYDEIILVGSGKGVVKVSSIPQIKWFSSSTKMFKRLFSIYEAQLKL